MAKPSQGRRPKSDHECECPEWIYTFADLVMLMMGFFVILWVLKPAPGRTDTNPNANDDWIAVVAAVREAFGYLPDPHSNDPVDLHMLMKKLHTINPVKGPKDGSRSRTEKHGADGTDPEVQAIRDGKQAAVGGRVLFDRSQAMLAPEGKSALDQIAEQIRGHYNIVQVKGHASVDDLPDGSTPQQLMELSLRRAQSAADYLTAHGVGPEFLRVQGCSVYEPLIQHAYAPDARALNRRVEVEVTSMLLGERQGSPPQTQPQSRPVTSTH